MTFLYVRCQHTLCDTVGSFLFYLMLRRPPRSTLFPTRRSSDLVEILVAVFIYRPGVHAEFKQMPHALRISDACELREQFASRSEEHTSELQSLTNLVCRLLLEKKKRNTPRRRSSSKARTAQEES